MSVCQQLRIAVDYADAFEAWGFSCCMVEDEPDKVLLLVRARISSEFVDRTQRRRGEMND